MVKFSIVVPAFNEAKYIGKTLKALKKQTLKDFEIIVKDGQSRDKTVEIARRHADKVVSTRDISVADARNQGAYYTEGEILVFVDADTIVPSYILRRFAELMKDENIVGVSCRKTPQSQSLLDRMLYELVNLSVFIDSILGLAGAHGNCMAIRKSVFEKVRGFNPKIQVAEEQELVRRAKKLGKFLFLLDMNVVEHPRRIKKWGKLRLYAAWTMGMLRSFSAEKRQPYEKVR